MLSGLSFFDPALSGFASERREGELYTAEAVSLELNDDEIAAAIGNRVTDSEKYWNTQLDLDNVRDKNEKRWIGNYFDESKLYDFQVPYKNNRIFVAIETLIPLALARPPQPIVVEAYDTEASRELARNLEKWLLGKYEDLYLKSKFMMIARHLLIGYRIAVMKYRWDTTVGQLQDDGTRFGDIDVDVKRPQRVVIDAGAQDIDNIPLVGEYLTATGDELCQMYPEKKDLIYSRLGTQPGVSTPNLHKQVGYIETWFDYHKEDGEMISAVAWKFNDIVLDSMKNPHWNHEEYTTDDAGNQVSLNFLERPKHPYVFFNFLNIGRFIIDDTSLVEQAAVLQDVLDKRGRQIVENADQANAGTVLNSDMIKPTEVAKLLGDPGEKLMVKGDVRAAAARLPVNLLPDYVMQDKVDARNEIDNIFSTHGAVRGEVTKSKTLGQDVLSQRGDASRIQTLATAIEDGGDRLYKGLVQMAKVMYDVPQLQRFATADGGATFAEFSNKQVQPGTKVRIKTGSVLPEDRVAKREETVQMMAVLDPLSIAEGLNKDNPTEFAKRLLYYRVFPDRYMTEILKVDPTGAQTDPAAEQEIAVMNSGKEAPPQQNPTKQHIATHQAFIESPQFQQLPPEIQQLHMVHVKAEIEVLKGQMGMGERPGMPPQPNGQQPQSPAPNGAAPANAPPQQTNGIMSKVGNFLQGR